MESESCSKTVGNLKHKKYQRSHNLTKKRIKDEAGKESIWLWRTNGKMWLSPKKNSLIWMILIVLSITGKIWETGMINVSWFMRENIDLIDLSSFSPNLNPIENL